MTLSSKDAADGLRVLIADDHPATRAGIRRILESEGFVVCAEAQDAAAAVQAAARERPDLCLVDVRMPGGGISATGAILRAAPEAHVVVLTVSDDDEDLFAALRAGASGYLLKDMDPARLTAALRGVLRGEAAVPRNLVARLVQQYRERGLRRLTLETEGRSVELTEREWEILGMLRDGLSTTAMAERLVISPVTVRRHISGLLTKLRVPDREAAIRLLDEDDTAR